MPLVNLGLYQLNDFILSLTEPHFHRISDEAERSLNGSTFFFYIREIRNKYFLWQRYCSLLSGNFYLEFFFLMKKFKGSAILNERLEEYKKNKIYLF